MAIRNELQKHTLNLRAGDWDKLADAYPDTETSRIIRSLVSNVVDALSVNASPNPEVEMKL